MQWLYISSDAYNDYIYSAIKRVATVGAQVFSRINN